MVYVIYNELVTGAYKPTNITGEPHIVSQINVYDYLSIYLSLSLLMVELWIG